MPRSRVSRGASTGTAGSCTSPCASATPSPGGGRTPTRTSSSGGAPGWTKAAGSRRTSTDGTRSCRKCGQHFVSFWFLLLLFYQNIWRIAKLAIVGNLFWQKIEIGEQYLGESFQYFHFSVFVIFFVHVPFIPISFSDKIHFQMSIFLAKVGFDRAANEPCKVCRIELRCTRPLTRSAPSTSPTATTRTGASGCTTRRKESALASSERSLWRGVGVGDTYLPKNLFSSRFLRQAPGMFAKFCKYL